MMTSERRGKVDQTMSEPMFIEFGVWCDGKWLTPLSTHQIVADDTSRWTINLQMNVGYSGYRVDLDSLLLLGNNWITCRMFLSDWSGSLIGTPRPALIFTGASDVAMPTMFPETYGEQRMFAVFTRAAKPRHEPSITDEVNSRHGWSDPQIPPAEPRP
jgi:hypothetical protein